MVEESYSFWQVTLGISIPFQKSSQSHASLKEFNIFIFFVAVSLHLDVLSIIVFFKEIEKIKNSKQI